MISVLLDMACLANSIQEKRFWFQIHWGELKLCSQRWRAWKFLPQQTRKRTGFAGTWSQGWWSQVEVGGWEHKMLAPHGIQEAAKPLCDFQDAEHCTVQEPKPLCPWRQRTTFEGGEPPSNKPHKLKQQTLQQLSTRTENRRPSVQYSWCFFSPLGSSRCSEWDTGKGVGVEGGKGDQLEWGWPASQAGPSIFKLIQSNKMRCFLPLSIMLQQEGFSSSLLP